ncbi:FmdB family zinc ribbon protein [Dehalogenimonas etheniformans]|uniref:Zinc ribbon domain-containing protein n=1 Tax=Dehalogenimonas etheniformans TaxID=1536648 RepID=A0A2P5P634_9CHLR|nr:zinc ribbon domain-containing protein [Dehalogenimonas etheniformans]PPD57768.1 zinc ribbon domain-containing protein [Dehalogenimonas etheniformans]QNT76109.1 zinc ribbon domain-containing protein [Dehalogenimonas etheniformans]
MPIYEYKCKKCTKRFELLRRFSDTAEVTCPKCGSTEVERKISSFSCGSSGSGSYSGSSCGSGSGGRVSS